VRIFLDNIEYTENADLDGLTINYTEDSTTKSVQRKISGVVTFVGDAYTYLNSKLFAGCDSFKNIITATIETGCCDVSHDLKIVYNTVEKSDCEFKVTFQDISDEVRGFRYLNETIYWKNGFIDSFSHPKIKYCVNNYGFISIVLLVLRYSLWPILVSLQLAEDAIKAISLGLVDIDIPSLDNYDKIITGCGLYQTAPLITDIINYNCQQAGLIFSSSILLAPPYNRTALFQAQYEKGARTESWIEENAANLTTIQLLELLKPVYNADYRIIDGTLHFEHPDKLDELNKVEIDLTDEEYALKYETIDAPAYGRFEYTLDAMDQTGNEAAPYYNDIIEWNDPPNDYQKGSKQNTIGFSPARFMFDRAAIRDAKKFNADFLIDVFRKGNNILFGTASERRSRDLVLSSHVSSELKLIVLKENYDPNDAEQMRRKIDRFRKYNYYEDNYPMYFEESNKEGLYEVFHKQDDPRGSSFAKYTIRKIEKLLTCKDVLLIEEYGNNIDLVTDAGTGRADNIKVNFGSGLITFENIRIKC